jgi:hypothetical protein
MVCPKCGATVADDRLECSGCGEAIGLTVWTADGQQYGPYTVAAVRQYVAEGRIDPRVSQARLGDGQWGPLHDTLASVGVDLPAPPPPLRAASGTSGGGSGGEWLARQVPYRNAPALTAYYLGVFGLIPFLGVPLALVAIPLGVVGLRRAREHPEAHGSAHAWTGIVAGALSVIGHGALIAWLSTQ